MNQRLIIFVALVLTTAGCGASQTTQDGGKDGTSACTPGKQINCGCSVGHGVQVCKEDGSSYGTCLCADGGKVDGGKDATKDSTIMESGPGDGGDAPTDTGMKETGGQDGGSCTIEGGADSGPGGKLNWAKRFGFTGQTTPFGVALDPSNGDVVVAGYYGGQVNFGGGLLTSVGDGGSGSDAFVVRLDRNGSYKWAKAVGNGLYVGAGAVAVDGSGNVLVAGTFQGSIDFGCGPLVAAGNDDIFLLSLASDGVCVWNKHFGAASQDQGLNSAATDSAGNVFIAGQCNSADFGGGAKTGFFIAKFGSTGTYSWSDAFAAMTTQGGPWLAVDTSGNSILAGSFNTTVNFGGGTLTSAGSADAFVAKFDSSGAYLWAKQYGDASEQDITKVAAGAGGDIVVTGDFGGSIDLGTGALTNTGAGNDLFLAKLTVLGGGVWSHKFVGSATDLVTAGSVAVDACDGVEMTNLAYGAIDYGGGSVSGLTSGSAAIARFDSSGDYGWAQIGGPPSTVQSLIAYDLSVASHAGAVVLVGGFGACATTGCRTSPPGSTLVLGGKTLTAVSVQDAFVASFVP